MKVFVTGGTGFVGSHLIDALLRRGTEVVCLARSPAKATALFTSQTPEIVPGSLDDPAALREGCRGADVVYHVAGVTAARNRDEFFAVNALATKHLIDAAKAAAGPSVRFVYVSSLAAAGPSTPTRMLTEQDEPRPLTSYGESKLAGEGHVRESGLAWTIVRPPTVYGPRDTELLRLFKLARLGLVPVFGDGSQLLSLVYVEDLAEALINAAGTQGVGDVFFASHPEVVTSRALATAVHAAVRNARGGGGAAGRADPWVVPLPSMVARPLLSVVGAAAGALGKATLLTAEKANEFFAPAWTCSAASLERRTGWRAAHDLEAGLPRTASWYVERDWL